ncbi:cytosine deaminase [Vacuolonema iberomarrocanum]|uniref:cytosine deaminase n=1 Tax=Vacuolonema iberomarrocanum TaxID=3454632 RepID=UPI0019F609F8|nr:cytosine deaminase [filamentous cyanobacterium LEGE 07170]
MQIPASSHFWLTNAHIPVALLSPAISPQTRDGLALMDIEIRDGQIAQVRPAGTAISGVAVVDLRRGIVFPCFADLHTHLDKGHTWERAPNPTGHFDGALEALGQPEKRQWPFEDIYRRMEFGLKCSYAHGSSAVRTHLDSGGELADINFAAFAKLREEWRDRLHLQAVSLVSLDYWLTPEGEKLADLVVEYDGILGGVAFKNPDIDAQIERVFDLAHERGLNLDFHVDESPDPASDALYRIARTAQRHAFSGQIVCGHCCSLSLQDPEQVTATIEAVKHTAIGVVSLPLCNLYLQDRDQEASLNLSHIASSRALAHLDNQPTYTPRWRGVTLLHELKQSGIPVTVANDNCRDAFHAFGDHDMLEVFRESTRIAHFDTPYTDWCRTVTATPADLMGLPTVGRIGVGLPADLVLFSARYFSELLSRPQSDRMVLRNGKAIDTTLPRYEELDDLM